MKKVLVMVFGMLVMGSLLAGCYSHTCGQPQPMNMKGEG